MEAYRVRRLDTSEEEDDFVTPLEKFGSSGKKRAAQIEGGTVRSSFARGKHEAVRAKLNSGLRKPIGKVVAAQTSRVRVPSRRAKDIPKKIRTYDGYIQKKFSPAIMTDVLLNLSDVQKDWVRRTGLDPLMHFRMMTYPHRLGYKIVDAFCGETCALKLESGDLLITDGLVHKVMGLPLGEEEIILDEGVVGRTKWDEQYATTQISPKMIRDKILNSRSANYNFKMNFLTLLFNFFFEAKQNMFVSRSFLCFTGDIDDCKRYNWCSLLIKKLKATQRYWQANKKRNFAGPLPFLIYCYVCCVQSDGKVQAINCFPWYRGWSDMMLRERQKLECGEDTFGKGVIFVMDDCHEDGASDQNNDTEATIEPCGVADLLIQDMVAPDSISGGDILMGVDDCVNEVDDDMDVDGGREETLGVGDNLKEKESDCCDEFQEQRKEDLEGGLEEVGRDLGGELTAVHAVHCDKATAGDPFTEQSTQARADLELELHFEEEPYMKRFASNLQELDTVYSKCLTNFVDSLALYPQNRQLSELKKKYKHFFKMFGESSPVTKSLSGMSAMQGMNTMGARGDDDGAPSCSLGLTQMFAKNLGNALDNCVSTPEAAVAPARQSANCFESRVVDKKLRGRPQRTVIPTAICRSPLVTGMTDISSYQLTAEERDVWDWLTHDKADDGSYIFEWKERACTKAHFHSLEDGKPVETTVIDTWTVLLNENEILRAVSTPYRLFLNSETTYGPLSINVSKGDTASKLNRYAVFDDNMEVVVKMVNESHNVLFDIPDFDMFLFPMYSGVHHYIVCYNIKKPRWEILDNRVQEMLVEDTYGDLPWLLHDCFCQFLECYNLHNHGEIVNLQPTIVTMGWQTVDNVIDCGVFVMRHLESYLGNNATWNCGLRSEQDNQKTVLHKLRVIYAHRMLLWAENRKRHLVLNNMVQHVRRKLVGV